MSFSRTWPGSAGDRLLGRHRRSRARPPGTDPQLRGPTRRLPGGPTGTEVRPRGSVPRRRARDSNAIATKVHRPAPQQRQAGHSIAGATPIRQLGSHPVVPRQGSDRALPAPVSRRHPARRRRHGSRLSRIRLRARGGHRAQDPQWSVAERPLSPEARVSRPRGHPAPEPHRLLRALRGRERLLLHDGAHRGRAPARVPPRSTARGGGLRAAARHGATARARSDRRALPHEAPSGHQAFERDGHPRRAPGPPRLRPRDRPLAGWREDRWIARRHHGLHGAGAESAARG